jgi:hypothetical protein
MDMTARLAAMDAAALVAELRALSDAGSSYDEQVQCCFLLQKLSAQPTGAEAEAAVRAVVSALSRGVQHALLQMAGCGSLGNLVQAVPATSAAVGAEGVAAVLATLRAYPGDAGVQGLACFALARLVARDAANRDTAGAAGGVAAVVAALTQHAAIHGVALHGCAALSDLTDDHPQNAAAALDAGAVAAVLAVLKAFPADAEVQGAACCTLSYVGSAADIGSGAEDAVAGAVLDAMRAHADDSAVQVHACNVLTHIFHDDKNENAVWARRAAAAITVVTAALHTHLEVVSIGCSALSCLMLSVKVNQRAAGVTDVIKAIVAALRAFPAVEELQLRACIALGHTCCSVRDNQLAAESAGGLALILLAMRTHTPNMRVQVSGCFALSALMVDVPSNQTRTGELGGVEVLVAALRARVVPLPAECAEFFMCWCTTLMLLMRGHPIHKQKAAVAGAIELLVAHMGVSAGVAVPSVFSSACFLLQLLLDGAGYDARAVLAGALEALEAQRAETAAHETARLQLIRDLQPLCARCRAAARAAATAAPRSCCAVARAAPRATAGRRTSARTGAATRARAARRHAMIARLLAPAVAELGASCC